ncbi:hypothetical protein [Actinomyces gaoshouyii]|nr:hypothetical protein [Actinomyces gaoshouyii]ARD41713.1 hypothetical protein B6G06_04625 [Actinomyces gaoshouyii]
MEAGYRANAGTLASARPDAGEPPTVDTGSALHPAAYPADWDAIDEPRPIRAILGRLPGWRLVMDDEIPRALLRAPPPS